MLSKVIANCNLNWHINKIMSFEMKENFKMEVIRQLSGLVAERWPAALEAGGQTLGGGPKNFQNRLSSAETQQPVDRMRRKARGCLVLSVLC